MFNFPFFLQICTPVRQKLNIVKNGDLGSVGRRSILSSPLFPPDLLGSASDQKSGQNGTD